MVNIGAEKGTLDSGREIQGNSAFWPLVSQLSLVTRLGEGTFSHSLAMNSRLQAIHNQS